VDGEEVGVRYVYESRQIFNNLATAIRDLEDQGSSCITSDCGFLSSMQPTALKIAAVPVLLSAVDALPLLDRMLPPGPIVVLTADSRAFRNHYIGDATAGRFHVVGLEEVVGFGPQVTSGRTVEFELAESAIVDLVQQTIGALGGVRAVVSECSELPGYTNALRERLGVPVFDHFSAVQMLSGLYAMRPFQALDTPRAAPLQMPGQDSPGAIHGSDDPLSPRHFLRRALSGFPSTPALSVLHTPNAEPRALLGAFSGRYRGASKSTPPRNPRSVMACVLFGIMAQAVGPRGSGSRLWSGCSS
jgi:hypothetical protein